MVVAAGLRLPRYPGRAASHVFKPSARDALAAAIRARHGQLPNTTPFRTTYTVSVAVPAGRSHSR